MEKNVNIDNFFSFLKASPTAFQAVCNLEKELVKANYIKLSENRDFNIEKGKNYYLVRDDSSIIAFQVPNNLDDLSLNIVASHTDSPALKIKPNSTMADKNYNKINTEVYGGPINSSFLDRPLSVAGRMFVEDNNCVKRVFVDVSEPLLVIPNLPIHLNHELNNGYKYNPQIDLLPLFSLGTNTNIVDYVAKKNNIKGEILGSDLFVYPVFDPVLIGENKDLFMAQRIDNLECAYSSLCAFINSKNNSSLNVYASFDNEEVGSRTKQGAGSTFLEDVLEEVYASLNLTGHDLRASINKGILVSADNAHALSPNVPSKFDPTNNTVPNKGVVIKYNANGSYTTDGLSNSLFMKMTNKANFQKFTNRSDSRGGGTLGAISLSHVSIKSVDIGLAQFAMHSQIETAGVKDFYSMQEVLRDFYSAHLTVNDAGDYEVK